MEKILVVDDEKSLREVMSIMLKRAGYAVTEAADGEEAIGQVPFAPDGKGSNGEAGESPALSRNCNSRIRLTNPEKPGRPPVLSATFPRGQGCGAESTEDTTTPSCSGSKVFFVRREKIPCIPQDWAEYCS